MIHINGPRLLDRVKEMARIGAFDAGEGVHRLALSGKDIEARLLLRKWFEELGLRYEFDAAGNMYGIYGNAEKDPPVVVGSHLDTVAYGGKYDGSLGVLAALEVVECLLENGVEGRPLVVANFTNEEGVRFTPDMMGSLYASRQCSIDRVHTAVALDNGQTMGEELKASGYLGKYSLPKPHTFMELHIEQGPVLEAKRIAIGVVTGVTGIVWKEVTITGQSNHAGTTPIEMRRDTGLAAAKIIQYAREVSIATKGAVTVGRMHFEPNVTNIIPGKAVLTLDIRNTSSDQLKIAVSQLDKFLQKLSIAEQLQIEQRALVDVAPVQFSPIVVDALTSAAKLADLSLMEMPSGAGHDAQLMAGYCPSGMIFIPSRDGISHHKKEYSTPESIINGANVLLNATASLMSK